MSKAPKQPEVQIPKSKKVNKGSKWINALTEDDPQALILTLFEENNRLRREIDQIKKINFAIKKDMDELHARLIQERYENLYVVNTTPDMELDNN